MLKLSRNLQPYQLVIRSGNKLISAGKRNKKPYGIWQPFPEKITVKTRLLNGELHTVSMDVPAGIRVYGPSKCLMQMEEKKCNTKK